MHTIYAIREVCNKSVIYIGYTINFNNRKGQHKYSCLNPKSKGHHLPIYKYIRENGGYDKFEFVVLEQSKDDIRFKEREYITKYGLDNLLNVKGGDTGLSTEEYKKKHYEKNKEREQQRGRVNYQKNKERENERSKAYRLAKKEELKEKRREKFNCECGSIISKGAKAEHFRSIKHLSYINNA